MAFGRCTLLAIVTAVPLLSQSFQIVNILPRPSASTTGELRFQALSGGSYVSFRAPNGLAGNVNWTLPSADIANALCSNGAGTLSFACGTISASIFQINTSTVIDASSNGKFATLYIGGVGVIDGSRNGTFQTLTSNLSTTTQTLIVNSISIFSGNLTFSVANTINIGSTSFPAANVYAAGWNGINAGGNTSVLITVPTFHGGSIKTYDYTGATIQNQIDESGVKSNVGFNASGSAGISSVIVASGTCSLNVIFGLIVGKTGC